MTTVVLGKTMNTISATWTSSPSTPVGYGYAPITYYLYRYKAHSASWPADWTSATTLSASSSLSVNISSLDPDTQYDFEVIAANQFGTGPTSPNTTYSITTSNVPDAPTQPTVVLDSTGLAINITFSPAPSSHNNTITGYTVKFEQSSGSYASVPGICTSDMTGSLSCNGVSISTLLTQTQKAIGNEIKVKVSATNSDGTSGDSPVSSSPTVVYASIPVSSVTGLTATVVDSTSVQLNWTAMTSPANGYSSITLYTVEYKLSSDTTW